MTQRAEPAPPQRAADDVGFGIALTLGFAALVPFVESAAKLLGETTAPAQITWTRFAVHTIVIGVYLALFMPKSDWRPRPAWPLILRGFCTTTGTILYYASLAVMPLVEVIAIFFVQPLLLTALSAVVLKETVGWRRWAAVLVGMTGAMLIIGPNFDRIGWGAILPVLAALFHASANILTRRWAGAAPLLVFQFTTAATAVILSSIVLLAGWGAGIAVLSPHMPTGFESALLAIVAFGSIATNLMLTHAFRITPTSVIAPFLYSHIVGSAVMGYVIFSHFPGFNTIVGALLVIGAGLFVWWRETRASPLSREAVSAGRNSANRSENTR